MSAPPTPARPIGGAAVGLALVLVAVLVGVAAQRVTNGEPPTTAATAVAATGHTTTVRVVADGMRFHPDRIEVPPGDRLVIELTNRDHQRHDLVLEAGARTAAVARGDRHAWAWASSGRRSGAGAPCPDTARPA